jgi:hypothetical protein
MAKLISPDTGTLSSQIVEGAILFLRAHPAYLALL